MKHRVFSMWLSFSSAPNVQAPPTLLQFVEDLSSELSAMKLALRSRCRAVVADYWHTLEQRKALAAAGADGTAAAAGPAEQVAAAAGEPS